MFLTEECVRVSLVCPRMAMFRHLSETGSGEHPSVLAAYVFLVAVNCRFVVEHFCCFLSVPSSLSNFFRSQDLRLALSLLPFPSLARSPAHVLQQQFSRKYSLSAPTW